MTESAGYSLGRSAARGARHLMLSQAFRVTIQVSGLVILSRLLDPADFGYVAVAIAIVGFGEVIRDFGLSSAAIRTPNLTAAQRDVLFWVNSAIGVGLAVVLVFLAQPLSAVFGIPPLGDVLPVLGIVFVLNGINAQYRADLNRSMRFQAMAIVDALGPLAGLAVGTICAVSGWGYWALVVQTIVAAAATLTLSVLTNPWLPRWPQRGHDAGRLLKFGGNVAVSQVFAHVGTNVDTLVLGFVSSPYSVGLYNRSFQLVMSPLNQLRSPALSVAIPALSRVRHDATRYENYLLRGQTVLGYGVLPVAAVLAGAAQPVVRIALGDGWSQIAPLVTVLAVAGSLQLLSSVASWIFTVSGLGRELQRYNLVSLALKVVGVCALADFGAFGVACGYTAAVVLAWPIALFWATRKADLGGTRLFAQTVRMILLAMAAGIAAYGLTVAFAPGPVWVQLLLAIFGTIAVYVAGLQIPVVRRDVRLVVQTLRMAISRP